MKTEKQLKSFFSPRKISNMRFLFEGEDHQIASYFEYDDSETRKHFLKRHNFNLCVSDILLAQEVCISIYYDLNYLYDLDEFHCDTAKEIYDKLKFLKKKFPKFITRGIFSKELIRLLKKVD